MAGVLKPSPGALRIIDDLEGGLAIVVNGDTAPKNIAAGQYLFIKNHSTLATGGYHATAAISSGGTISSSNVAADADGIANSLNSKFSNTPIREIVYVSGTTSQSGIIEITITNAYVYAFCLTNVSQNLANPYSVTVDNFNNATHKMNLRIRNMSDNTAVANTTVGFDVMIIGI